MERLQKIMARAGLASRREAEQWILDGRVAVNGAVIRKLGTRADLSRDSIKVDGKRIKPAAAPLYFAFHKPTSVLTTLNDPQHRPDLTQFVEKLGRKKRVFPVGRLDYNSTGLLLLTNDGELAQRVAHPRFGVKKLYQVKLSACPTEEELGLLRRGIRLEDGITAPARVRVVERLKKNAWVEIEILEGRNREVRRMFEALRYFVEKLIRLRVGPILLGSLPAGALRPLSPAEIKSLKQTVGLETVDSRKTPPLVRTARERFVVPKDREGSPSEKTRFRGRIRKKRGADFKSAPRRD
jgi:23S rRNA pseudouridine2605 synthase